MRRPTTLSGNLAALTIAIAFACEGDVQLDDSSSASTTILPPYIPAILENTCDLSKRAPDWAQRFYRRILNSPDARQELLLHAGNAKIEVRRCLREILGKVADDADRFREPVGAVLEALGDN